MAVSHTKNKYNILKFWELGAESDPWGFVGTKMGPPFLSGITAIISQKSALEANWEEDSKGNPLCAIPHSTGTYTWYVTGVIGAAAVGS